MTRCITKVKNSRGTIQPACTKIALPVCQQRWSITHFTETPMAMFCCCLRFDRSMVKTRVVHGTYLSAPSHPIAIYACPIPMILIWNTVQLKLWNLWKFRFSIQALRESFISRLCMCSVKKAETSKIWEKMKILDKCTEQFKKWIL